MHTQAVVFDSPGQLARRRLALVAAGEGDAVVDVEWTGISTGTERLLWTGTMPAFPGLGYPLVPGYETVGRLAAPTADGRLAAGDRVFVGGARCFPEARCLFGGTAGRLVVPADRLTPLPDAVGADGTLLALAATAHHALLGGPLPELVVGHGALGRLVARLVPLLGGPPPVVWETNPDRLVGARDYAVRHPEDEAPDRRFAAICDVSGDAGLLDTLIARLAPRGEIALAGFYAAPLAFAFPAAFRCEARLRVAAEWQPADLAAVAALVASGRLALDGILSHAAPAAEAGAAYAAAFGDPACIKMALDWRSCA